MKYYYTDSCFLITSYQSGYLDLLSKYKSILFISRSQLIDELIKPKDLKDKVMKCITIIDEDNKIKNKTIELKEKHIGLSYYDCLSLAFAIIDGYILISDDKALKNAAILYNVKVVFSSYIISILK